MTVEELELQLDSFDLSVRRGALDELIRRVEAGEIELSARGGDVNVHFHSFFSYNACGYSPSKIAWLSRKAGLAVAGLVDFDVFDGLDEFYEAGRLLGLKASVGMETRVFVPEFSDKVINSPGEPGIAYHTGVGFVNSKLDDKLEAFKASLVDTVAKRNRDLIDRVNSYLGPVVLDYEKDVWPLTPSKNATERHICLAYARKAKEVFNDDDALRRFWSEKLDWKPDVSDLPEGRDLLDTIRAKTMKRGGVGYVQADAGAFPKMADANRFILAGGGIPTFTWLNGFSDGEQAIEELLEIAMSTGAAAINIIPDRNYTPCVKDEKLVNLQHVVALAEKLDLPIIVGTEMNSPGQKFVDDFSSKELKPMVPTFLKGAHIAYAHSAMQRQCRMGYTSQWAVNNFATVSAKNDFFQQLGSLLEPNSHRVLSGLDQHTTPKQILDKI